MSVSPRPLAQDARPSCSRQTGLEKEAEKSEKVRHEASGLAREKTPSVAWHVNLTTDRGSGFSESFGQNFIFC